MSLRSAWEWVTKSRYTCYLEQELERTRFERDGFRDALLESMNLPRIQPHQIAPIPKMKQRLTPSQWRTKLEALTTPSFDKSNPATPKES